MSVLVLDITIWLKQKHAGRFKYDLNDGIPQLNEFIKIVRKNDDGAVYVNKFETEEGGEEKTLASMDENDCSITHDRLKPFFHKPMINRHKGTFHVKVAVRSSQAMKRGYEQRTYLAPIFHKFNNNGYRFAAFDPVQEINQFKIGALVGITPDFNEVDARMDLMKDAVRLYETERKEAKERGDEYEDIQIELKLI